MYCAKKLCAIIAATAVLVIYFGAREFAHGNHSRVHAREASSPATNPAPIQLGNEGNAVLITDPRAGDSDSHWLGILAFVCGALSIWCLRQSTKRSGTSQASLASPPPVKAPATAR